jgi:hypothetical protein
MRTFLFSGFFITAFLVSAYSQQNTRYSATASEFSPKNIEHQAEIPANLKNKTALGATKTTFGITVQGKRARLTALVGVVGGRATDVSPNGRYVTGIFNSQAGFRYDIQTDSLLVFADVAPKHVADDGTMLGEKYTSGNLFRASIYKNNEWVILPGYPGFPAGIFADDMYLSVAGYGLSRDGKTAAGMIHYPELDYSPHAGIIWKNEEFEYLLHPKFPISPGSTYGIQGYGARVNDISADGNVVYGWGAYPTQAQRTPHVWIDTVAYYVGKTSGDRDGEVRASNSTGTVLVGDMLHVPTLWTRSENNEFAMETLQYTPGYTGAQMFGISDSLLAIGILVQEITTNRRGMVWSRETGMLPLDEFLDELYGLPKGWDYSSPSDISQDNRIIAGWGVYEQQFYTFIIEISDTTILPRPRTLLAKQQRGTLYASLTWQKPLKTGRDILGYYVYRDGFKLDTLVNETSFKDLTVEGIHTYTVSSVYNEGESAQSEESTVQIIPLNGCYSVGGLAAYKEYNRNVFVSFGLSSDREEDGVHALNIHQTSAFSCLSFGEYYYMGSHSQTGIFIYNQAGVLVKIVEIPGLGKVTALTTDGTSIYAGSGAGIYEIDVLGNGGVLNYIPVSGIPEAENISHLAYIPEIDGFEVGSWYSSDFINRMGISVGTGLDLVSGIAGSVYYQGKIYTHEQDGPELSTVREYDAITGIPTGVEINPWDNPAIRAAVLGYGETPGMPEINYFEETGIAGAITFKVFEDGTVCLVPLYQVNGGNLLLFLEWQKSPNLIGYNVYRNGDKQNTVPMSERYYFDTLHNAGLYNYSVTAEFNTGCTSVQSDYVSVSIGDAGTCNPVTNISYEESNKQAFLYYGAPESPASSTGAALLGCNIYRDGEKINDILRIFGFYTDKTATLGTHTYRIEAFYENSCVASDSIEVTITGEGTCEPPTGLRLSHVADGEAADVTAEWSLPYYEMPYPLYYGEPVPVSHIRPSNVEQATAAIGWDTAGLNKFPDYKLGGIEFFIASEADVKPIVIINEQIKYYEPFQGQILPNEYNTVIFDEPISLQGAWELVVGYTASNYGTGSPFGVAYGAPVRGYGDLMTYDPTNTNAWNFVSSSDNPYNFAITALLVKQREVGTALRGFDLYRDGVKKNSDIIANTSYTDDNVAIGNYYYGVKSVWNNGCPDRETSDVYYSISSLAAERGILTEEGARFYPNPAHREITVTGDVSVLRIVDISGRILKQVYSPAGVVSIADIPAGTYTVQMQTKNGVVHRKLVVLGL